MTRPINDPNAFSPARIVKEFRLSLYTNKRVLCEDINCAFRSYVGV